MLVVAGRRWMPNVAALGSRPQGTRWNSASKTTNMVLSGSPTRTASDSFVETAASQSVRAAQSRNTGKRYFEITMVDRGDSMWAAGIMDNSAFPSGSPPGLNDAKGVSLLHDSINNEIYLWAQNAGTSFNLGTTLFINGDVFGFACDLSNRLMWLSRNGTFLNGNPSTPTGGISWGSSSGAVMYPGFYATIFAVGTATATINSGSSAFTGTLPAGYSAWGGND